MAKRLNLLGPSVGIRLIKFDGQVFSGEAAIQDSWSSVQSCKVRYPAIPSVHGVTSSAEGLGTAILEAAGSGLPSATASSMRFTVRL
ncbi:MAG: hypothetical protein QOH31_3929 [Verrucomicrobiota bacterium]|jgi:hypothetical protein